MSKNEKSGALTRRQTKALAALLVHAMVEDAARSCGVGASTIRRWLSEDTEFARSLSDALSLAVEQAFASLSLRSAQAVATLERNLTSGAAGVEVRAALGWLSLLNKRAEARRYQLLSEEVERLHQLLDERDEEEAA